MIQSPANLMCRHCRRIWQSEEYRLFPTGMLSFGLLAYIFDIEERESLFLG